MHPIKQPPLASKGATQLDEVQPSGGSGPVLRGPDSGTDSPAAGGGGRATRDGRGRAAILCDQALIHAVAWEDGTRLNRFAGRPGPPGDASTRTHHDVRVVSSAETRRCGIPHPAEAGWATRTSRLGRRCGVRRSHGAAGRDPAVARGNHGAMMAEAAGRRIRRRAAPSGWRRRRSRSPQAGSEQRNEQLWSNRFDASRGAWGRAWVHEKGCMGSGGR